MRNKYLFETINIINQIKSASQIKVKRNFMNFFSDRIRQAVTEPTLIRAIERLQSLVSVEISRINKKALIEFIKTASKPEANDILNWLREYPNLAAMISFLNHNDAMEAIEQVDIVSQKKKPGSAVLRRLFDIEIKIKCTTPLAHGGDYKAGNATLFRRMDVLSDTNSILSLPYYAGNAIRGQIRDLLADHFLISLDIMPRRDNPPIKLWFFYCLYSGGTLEEKNRATAAISKLAGATTQKAENIKYIRNMMPALSLLGFAVGNRILPGRCNFGDFRPVCKEWGYSNSILSVGELFEWIFFTRRDDYEGHEDNENASMIINTECLKAGTELHGGIDISQHASDIEKGALAKGLLLLKKNGYIGAENRRDLGGIKIEYNNLPDVKPYEDFLKEKKQNIIEFLNKIEAIKC